MGVDDGDPDPDEEGVRATPAVCLDANELWGIRVLDPVLYAAEKGAFRPVWSESILEEVDRTQKAKGRDHSNRLDAMRRAFPKAAFDQQPFLQRVPGEIEPDDHHVVAAALAGGATIIVTNNADDFPAAALESVGLTRMQLCAFVIWLLEERRDYWIRGLGKCVADKSRPTLTAEEFLTRMARDCPEAVARVREVVTEIEERVAIERLLNAARG